MILNLTDAELEKIKNDDTEYMVKNKVVTRIMEGTYVPENNDELNDLLRRAINKQYRKDRELEDVFKRAYLESQGKYVPSKLHRICTLINKYKWQILVALFLIFCLGYTATEILMGFIYGVY